ncbi:ankyrin repeat-containing domain protein [Cadophora sp. MPI-SDFR-AT-0126]|nr:ankyrin repeat-containing domain protein [Leotiomycetes sp. MPI-SDFR-AT-0126]
MSSYHPLTTANDGDFGDFSFLDTLTFDSKEPSLNITDLGQLTPSNQLGLYPSRPIVPEKNDTVRSQRSTPTDTLERSTTNTLKRTATRNNGQTNPVKEKKTVKMAPTVSKPQMNCLELCHKTTMSIDLIAVHILEYLTTAKQVAYGFEPLAHDFLDTCQILFSIEAGLGECNRSGQKLPQEMLTELDHKFRVTQADFNILNQMLVKMIAPSSKLARSWGKLFGDNDIKKISMALAKTRESLRMSSLMFQWSLGEDNTEKEKGIGFTGLAAALDRMDHKAGKNGMQNGMQNGMSNGMSHNMQNGMQNGLQSQHQSYQQPQAPWSNRSSSIHHDSPLSNGRMMFTNGLHAHAPGSPDHRHQSTNTNGSDMLNPYDPYGRHSAMDDARSVTNITEPDSLHEEFALLELDPSKVMRHSVDPSSMPRVYPRNGMEGDNANMKGALVSAIRNKNYKLIEQLLHRGVSPNLGFNMHPLREAIMSLDEESLRLLLLFGADPNESNRDSITPLFVCVERSFLSGATLLLKYGADPNLVAGPELESPLAIAAMGTMVAFTHLFLSYNGDANHMTASGAPILTSAIKKKTPKKFIDMILAYGAKPNTKTREGHTALFDAISLGRVDIVTSLLENKADPNLPGPKHMLWPAVHYPKCLQVLFSHGADHKKAPGIMELAVSINSMESVRIILNAGVSPDTKKDGVYTPLCTSIRDDRADMLKLLLANNADPNLPASEYPCFKCVTHDRVHYLPLLVAAGANLNNPKGIIEEAVNFNNVEALNWLLEQGVNPNDRSPKGHSALTTAIRENRPELVDLLLMRGADPHVRGENWPLCMAVAKPQILKKLLTVVKEPQAFKGIMEMAVHADQLESVKMLIAAGVSVEDKNGGVFSPLTTAIREDHRPIVKYLLTDGGADVNSPGEHLPIVKSLRTYRGNETEILELLLEHGADPNMMYRGWNGVMQAVENGEADVLRLLARKAGVDLEVRDEMGRTVVEMAASRGWDEAVQILIEGDMGLRMRK